ncbi:MAG: aromatic-ring-hydroxylating dioxygenase subunit beta [Alphaproteobacteria bacterium]|nr:aromatic-ring-hydroxylating dioxygenase subunit beta [Alphaproteobacteria bacterium]
MSRTISRAEVEEFLYAEAALLDAWDLEGWLALLSDDARYHVPSNEQRGGDPAETLFLIADDIHRIRARVARLQDRAAHAEQPRSRTRRLIANVRIVGQDGDELAVEANFAVHHFRRGERLREYVGQYRYRLRLTPGGLRIIRREALLDALELGSLGSVSFIL